MPLLARCKRFFARPHLRLIAIVGLIVPRHLRADWRQEWETELRCREMLLADWDRLDRRSRIDLLRRSTSAFQDALWLQRRRVEAEVIQDLRYGVRLLAARPAFTAVAVLILALGIGANAAIFTLLDKTLIRPLPVPHPEQLVTFDTDPTRKAGVFSYPRYAALRDGNDVLSGLAAFAQRPFSLTDGTRSERVTGQIVSGNYFDVLGVQPALGRFFLPEEDRTPGSHAVAVISHGLWRRRYGADPAALGKPISINAYRYTIVGVTPSEFSGTTRSTITDVYLPAMMAEVEPGSAGMLTRSTWGWLRLIGRLKPQVTREQAQAALDALAAQVADVPAGAGPKGREKFVSGVVLADGSRGQTDRVEDLSLPLKLLMGMVVFVLIIAGANVASLLLARASTRRKEIGLRLAIGASPWRIARQMVTESALLALLGGGTGLLVAYWLAGFLSGFQQQTVFVPRTIDGRLDARALAFTAGVSLLAAIVFSIAPARHASKTDLTDALRTDVAPMAGWTRRFTLRNLLVVAQIALSLVVLIGAGLCIKSLRALQAVDPGLEPAKVVTASFSLAMNGYDEARGRHFMSDLTARVAALPGVEAVAFANIVAFSDLFWVSGASIEGYEAAPNERIAFDFNAVSPNYFRTVGTPLVSGREFTAQDTANAPRVVIVNEAAARRYWPGRDPVGRRTSRGHVIGVVRNSKEKGLALDPKPTMYLSVLQSYTPDLTLHARTALHTETLLSAVGREVQALDPSLPVYNLQTLAQQRDGSLYAERVAAALLALFGALALALAAVGIYGLLAQGVAERTREIGIRLAHGAQPRDLVKLVVGEGLLLAAMGIVIGIGAAFALTRLMRHLLFGVSATDPLTFAAIPVLLVIVAALACWLPARRATRLSPLVALRYD